MPFAGIKSGGYNECGWINIFKIKAAGLRYLVAFFTTHAMLFNNKTDVIDDILLADGTRQHLMVVRKKKTHFLHVIADGTGGILFGQKLVVQLLKAGLGFC